MNVLVFNPYGHLQHNFHETIMGKLLAQSNHAVFYVRCGGFLNECDLRRKCTRCHLQQWANRSWFGITQITLDKWVDASSLPESYHQANTLDLEALRTVTYQNLVIHDLIESSVFTMLRITSIDWTKEEHRNVYRKTFRACMSLLQTVTKLLDTHSFEKIISFNGRMFPFQMMLQLAHQRDIPIYFLEQGLEKNTIMFNFNHKVHDYEHIQDRFSNTKHRPLSLERLVNIQEYFQKMQLGTNRTLSNHHLQHQNHPQENHIIRKSNDFSKTILVLPSSEDEHANMPEYANTFGDPMIWLEQTVRAFQKRPNVYCVFRFHPNSSNDRGGESTIQDFIHRHTRQGLPPNIDFIAPETPVSTYRLLDIADGAITAGSTVTLEMIFKNNPVILTRHVAYFGEPFVITAYDPSRYDDYIDTLLTTTIDAQTKAMFYRFLHQYRNAVSIPFPINQIYGKMVPFLPMGFESKLKTDPLLKNIQVCLNQNTIPTHEDIENITPYGSLDEEKQFIQREQTNSIKCIPPKRVIIIHEPHDKQAALTLQAKILSKRMFLTTLISPQDTESQRKWDETYGHLWSMISARFGSSNTHEYFYFSFHLLDLFTHLFHIRGIWNIFSKWMFGHNIWHKQLTYYKPDYVIALGDISNETIQDLQNRNILYRIISIT